MKWKKLGKIFDHNSFDVPWFTRMAMVPVPYNLSDEIIRIYTTFCDEENIGRIGYVDVNSYDPTIIIDYSKEPIIDIGAPGTFDDHGVVTASIIESLGKLYLYYSGYQLTSGPPYMIFAGVAVSENGGKDFRKLSTDVPMLDRIENEYATRCVPTVMEEFGKYKMWYAGDARARWVWANGKYLPEYELKYMESKSPIIWPRMSGITSVPLTKNSQEHGITRCTVWKEDGKYKMLYSIRSIDNGYRIGYGESQNGEVFIREDHKAGIQVSETGWDSQMIAFPGIITANNCQYMFYCGNHYGLGGIGVAERVDNKHE
jgi:hypothetical protein